MNSGSMSVQWSTWAVAGVVVAAPIAGPSDAYGLKYLVWVLLLTLVTYRAIATHAKGQLASPMFIALVWLLIVGVIQVFPYGSACAALNCDNYLSSILAPSNSLDLTATWEFLHAIGVLLAVCWWKNRYIVSRRDLRIIEYAIIVSATLQALYGTLSVLTGAEIGAFFQVKEAYLGSATGTFVNRSIYGLYLNLGIVVCLQVLFFSSFRPATYTLLGVRLAMLLMVIGVTMTHSRAVGLGFILIMVVAGLVALVRQRRKSFSAFVKVLVLIGSIAIVDVLVVSKWYGLERLVERASATSTELERRDDIARLLLNEYSVTETPLGYGAGSFEAVFPSMEPEYIHGRYRRAHADLVEIYVSLGVMVFPLIVLWGWAVLTAGVLGWLITAAVIPHLLLDFAATHWLIGLIIVLIWPNRASVAR